MTLQCWLKWVIDWLELITTQQWLISARKIDRFLLKADPGLSGVNDLGANILNKWSHCVLKKTQICDTCRWMNLFWELSCVIFSVSMVWSLIQEPVTLIVPGLSDRVIDCFDLITQRWFLLRLICKWHWQWLYFPDMLLTDMVGLKKNVSLSEHLPQSYDTILCLGTLMFLL